MVMVKATPSSEAGETPSAEMFEAMGKYNEELVNAGIMKDGDGLKPSSFGARVRFNGDQRTVIDGPFTETKELVAGYWLWECASLDEAIEWVKRAPMDQTELEIRQVHEIEDFAPVASKETLDKHLALRDQVAKQS
jgi:hypothetical protein